MKKAVRNSTATVVVALLLAGCSTAPNASQTLPELPDVSIEGLENVTAQLDYSTGTVSLPSDAYDVGSPVNVARMLHAIAVRTDACMTDKGFDAIADDGDWSPAAKLEERTLGRWSAALASTYGIDIAPDANADVLSLVGRDPEFTDSYSQCNDTAKQDLTEEIDFYQTVNIASDIRMTATRRADSSPEAKTALAAWRKCSEDSGIVIEGDIGVLAQEYTTQGKESEIAAYTAHAKCAESTGAVQTIFDLRARYETALIENQEAQLVAFTKELDAVNTKLDDVIAGR